MKNKKTMLFHSVIALLLCVSMLVGSTFAWFTDSVKTGINTIAAGVLDVELYHTNAAVADEAVSSATKLFMDLQGNPILWEPGVVSYENLRVVNAGDLALTYQLSINTANENFVIDPENSELYGLSQALQVGFVPGGITATDRAAVVASVETANWTTLAEFLRSGSLLPVDGQDEETWGVVVYWQPGDDVNRWNLNNGKSLNEGEVLNIDLGVKLVATQEVNELDGFDQNYDDNAKAEFFDGFQGGSAGAAVTLDDQGVTTAEVSMAGGDVSAVIPAGVQVAAGKNSLNLSVTKKAASEANIQLGESDEMRPLDVHIEGVAAGNTVPMLVTLKGYLSTGINTGALRLYHVENGQTVAMTQVANPADHNEFSYNPATGDVTLALESFSEVAVVADNNNPWNGETKTAYTGSGTEADPYLIANADQLAYFRDAVDGGNTFEGKFVKLNNNINLNGKNFEPIGWGYEYNDWNVGDKPGRPFKGTFDGNSKTIYNLYQNGWDLKNTYGNGEAYTYTNCGFGLFAAAADATFKNLTIYGADIRVECVETGILVGLSQGSCTYENIKIQESKIANYQRPTGGLIGEISPLNGGGETKITNVEIGSDVVVGSLWGDFDAPCGGVIGARWDDTDKTTVVMKDVTVGCRMDVYSDVTSAYQWYAYRRAGMLIGNTEQTAENNQHLAAARFLECVKVDGKPTVKVYYGDWAAYHYCQFTNQDNKWCNNYPWVRVEAGENCSAYSNPRYGQPVINGATVTTHDAGTCTDEHKMELRFNQLYGGGQGVYGQPVHDLDGDGENDVAVGDYQYSITYMNDYQVLAIRYINADEATKAINTAYGPAKDLVTKWADENIKGDYVFNNRWMNAGSTEIITVKAGNKDNIVLYPYFEKPYTARFVDQQGNVIAYCLFYDGDVSKIDSTRVAAEAALPDLGEDLKFDYWQVYKTDNAGTVTDKKKYSEFDFMNCEQDVTIYPVYLYKGDVNLIPVDNENDGIIDEYHVAGYSNPNGQAMVEIPDYVNGKPITSINANAFSSYPGVHSVVIPKTITSTGANILAKNNANETVTIYFMGTYDEWEKIEPLFNANWEAGVSTSTRIFFLNQEGKVITDTYLQRSRSGWSEKGFNNSILEEYTGYCDCKESTTGDTAHTYVRVNSDKTETIMQHNANGTPVNEQSVEIYWGVIKEGWFGSSIGEEKGLRDDDTSDTYKRYRPDAIYWEGVTIN